MDLVGAGRDPVQHAVAVGREGQEWRTAVIGIGPEDGEALGHEIVRDALDPLPGDAEAAGRLCHGLRTLGNSAQQLPAGLRLPLGRGDRLT